jgi:hypothetical protein
LLPFVACDPPCFGWLDRRWSGNHPLVRALAAVGAKARIVGPFRSICGACLSFALPSGVQEAYCRRRPAEADQYVGGVIAQITTVSVAPGLP